MSRGRRKSKRGKHQHRQVPRRDPAASTRPSPPQHRRDGRRLRWMVAIAGTVVVLGVIGLAWIFRPSPLHPEQWDVPEVDMRGVHGPVARAVASARGVLLERPTSAQAWGECGMVFDAHEMFDQAATCYGRAHELAPKDFRWVYFLGIVNDLRGADLDDVVSAFEAAIRLKPDYVAVYYRFGEALVRQGRMAEARDTFGHLVELSPDLATAYRGLGQVLLTMGEPEPAVRHLLRAAQLKPDEEKIFLALARGYTMLDDHARAAEALRRSKGLTGKRKLPDPFRLEVEQRAVDPDACVMRAQNNIAGGRFREAIPDLKLFEEVAPDHALAQMLLGLCYRRTGKKELALEHLSRAVILKDDLIDAHVQLAEMFTERGQRRRAIEHYRRALVHQPGNELLRARLRDLQDTG